MPSDFVRPEKPAYASRTLACVRDDNFLVDGERPGISVVPGCERPPDRSCVEPSAGVTFSATKGDGGA